MYKIGEFSKLGRVTVKTLRYYDESGILKPKYVDKWTNYRYYAGEQLIELQKIVSFRQAGLTLDEICDIMSGNDTQKILLKRQNDLEKEMAEINERILRITKLIQNLKENTFMKFQATIKEIEECKVYYGIKKLDAIENIGKFIKDLSTECVNANPNLKLSTCYVCYLDDEFSPVDCTVMYAQTVNKFGKETENVKFKTMPAITAVSVIVKGEYMENLPLGYAYAVEWIKEHGYEIIDLPRESYIDGPWNNKKPEEYLTELLFPINKQS